jgi:GntR family transcriptional regulator, transcriptional repressor for pyruvate dehydrogenase complex
MIERVMLSDSIVKEVKNYIVENNLKQGDKLPNQEQLCKIFGVSRTSLREALRTLKAIDIIDIKNGKGIYIKEQNVVNPNEYFTDMDEKNRIQCILETRRIVEGAAIKLAIQRATDDDIMIIESHLNLMSEKIKNGINSPEEDMNFHKAILNASKNPILIQYALQIYELLDFAWHNSGELGKALNIGLDYHIALFKSIKNRNVKEAEKTYNKILSEIELIILNIEIE